MSNIISASEALTLSRRHNDVYIIIEEAILKACELGKEEVYYKDKLPNWLEDELKISGYKVSYLPGDEWGDETTTISWD